MKLLLTYSCMPPPSPHTAHSCAASLSTAMLRPVISPRHTGHAWVDNRYI